MVERYRGKTVVVTGGSTGIGAAFAERFAREGARLLLVARTGAALEALARSLEAKHGATVRTASVDLSTADGPNEVLEAVSALGWRADVLVNNAGFASYGRFDAQPRAQVLGQIALNVQGLVVLTHAFLPQLLERRGQVIHVASTAAFQPVPYLAVYGATKAFVLSFSEALWAENRDRGLDVLALCPGATETPFFERVGAEEASLGARASPESVVDAAMKALAARRSHVIAGLGNYWTAQAARFVSRQAAARLTANLMKPRQAPALPASGARR